MIGVARTGSGFGGLARYLAAGKRGDEHERVAWIEAHNLMETDPERAARLMRATAEQNPRVTKPVYHLSVSFAPEDRVGPAEMRRVADRLLRDLGLGEHQALVIAHRDTPHQHLHLMINRVHPETGRAWHTGHDYARIERLLRSLERDLGIKRVPGRHSPASEHDRPSRLTETRGERRQRQRTGTDPWSARVRKQLVGEFEAARSWAELEDRLRRRGLRLRPRGRGLVVTDGRRSVKASRIHRSASAHRLAERFGMSYSEYRAARRELVAVARELRRLHPEHQATTPRPGADHPRARGAGRPARKTPPTWSSRASRAAQARAVRAALRLGLQGLSFVLRPGPLKAVRIALALARTVQRERGR